MNQQTLRNLFVDHISDLYDAEKQLVKALPKMAKAVKSEELADALRNHLAETQNQVTRLEEVFQAVGAPVKAKPCKGMKGLLAEGSEAIAEHTPGAMRDLALIAGAQKVEHYEISAYGTARAIAEHLELADAVQLLGQTEDEEKNADEGLTQIAMTIYEAAGDEDEDDADTDVDEEEDEEEDDEDEGDGSLGIPVPATATSKKASAKDIVEAGKAKPATRQRKP